MTNPGFRGPDPFAAGPPRSAPARAASGPAGPQPAGAFGGYSSTPAVGTGPLPVHRHSPPVTVWLAVAALVVAAGLCVAQAVLGILAAQRSDIDDAQVHYLGMEVADLSTTAIVFTVLFALIFALAYLAFAYAVWRGDGWPRPAGTVLAALSLFGLMGGPVIIALVVAGVLAVVLLWLPPSRNYSRSTGAAAQAPAAYDPWGGR